MKSFYNFLRVICLIFLPCVLFLCGCGDKTIRGNYYTARFSESAGESSLSFVYNTSAIGIFRLSESTAEKIIKQSTAANEIMMADGHKVYLQVESSDGNDNHDYGIGSRTLKQYIDILDVPLLYPSGLKENAGTNYCLVTDPDFHNIFIYSVSMPWNDYYLAMTLSMFPEGANINSTTVSSKSPEYREGLLVKGTPVDMISDKGMNKTWLTFVSDNILYEYTLNSSDDEIAEQLLHQINADFASS